MKGAELKSSGSKNRMELLIIMEQPKTTTVQRNYQTTFV